MVAAKVLLLFTLNRETTSPITIHNFILQIWGDVKLFPQVQTLVRDYLETIPTNNNDTLFADLGFDLNNIVFLGIFINLLSFSVLFLLFTFFASDVSVFYVFYSLVLK